MTSNNHPEAKITPLRAGVHQSGRDASEWLAGIDRNHWSRSSECAPRRWRQKRWRHENHHGIPPNKHRQAVQRLGATSLLCATLARCRSNKTIQELRTRLVTTQDFERSRIARELHDDVNQRLALLCMDMERLKEDCDGTSAYAESINDLLGQTKRLASDIGEVCYRLYPRHLDDLELAASLQSLCREISNKHGVQVNLKCRLSRQRPPKETALCLYRVAQEALQNVVKHSRASEATVELKGEQDGIEMSVSDSGTGFDASRVSPQAGLGLRSMRDRLRLIRGHMSIESGPSKGSQLNIWVPIG